MFTSSGGDDALDSKNEQGVIVHNNTNKVSERLIQEKTTCEAETSVPNTPVKNMNKDLFEISKLALRIAENAISARVEEVALLEKSKIEGLKKEIRREQGVERILVEQCEAEVRSINRKKRISPGDTAELAELVNKAKEAAQIKTSALARKLDLERELAEARVAMAEKEFRAEQECRMAGELAVTARRALSRKTRQFKPIPRVAEKSRHCKFYNYFLFGSRDGVTTTLHFVFVAMVVVIHLYAMTLHNLIK